MKKVITVLLCVVMMTSLLAAAVSAQSYNAKTHWDLSTMGQIKVKKADPADVVKDGVIGENEYVKYDVDLNPDSSPLHITFMSGTNFTDATAMLETMEFYFSWDEVHGFNFAIRNKPPVLQQVLGVKDQDPPEDDFCQNAAYVIRSQDPDDNKVTRFYYSLAKRTDTGEYLEGHWNQLGLTGSYDPEPGVDYVISYSGNTDELLRFLPLLIERKIPIIGVSGNPQSLLAQYSTCHLNIKVKREADPNNLAPTSSTTATLAMGDAIACALIEARHFQPMDFAQFHPGGSLGRKLLTKVKDVMHKKNLPILEKNMAVTDALVVISDGKLGLAIVLDGNNVAGLVTSGDIRRTFQRCGAKSFDLTVKEIMTISPVVINEEASLSDADMLFKKTKVNTLVVVNQISEFVGFLDFSDCSI